MPSTIKTCANPGCLHLIADEIAVGFGRTSSLFACEQAGIQPDFLCLSKGLTGGYLPLSVVMTTDPVFEAFYDEEISRGFLHSHSYTGNALACRAALPVLNILESEGMLQRNRQRASWVNARCENLRNDRRVRHFRTTGMIWAFDIVRVEAGFGREFYRRAIEAGVLLRPIGSTVYWMPPYIVEEQDMELLVRSVETIIAQMTP